jgi:hypothetical protein
MPDERRSSPEEEAIQRIAQSRAAVGGKLCGDHGKLIPKHLSLLTRTILFALLETPRGFPLYWRTADDPQYRDICEDDEFARMPVERKKDSDARTGASR